MTGLGHRASGSGQRPSGSGPPAGRCLLAIAWCLMAAACTDPRERPQPPTLTLSFSPTIEVQSPDTIEGTLFTFDEDGVRTVRLRAYTSGGALALDSTLLVGDFEATLPLAIPVPSGLPAGTPITIAAQAIDYAGFQTSDSTVLTTQP